MSRHSVLDSSFYSISTFFFAFSLKDTVMLQSAFRGHLLRESQLKVQLKDVQKKVSPTHTVIVRKQKSCPTSQSSYSTVPILIHQYHS